MPPHDHDSQLHAVLDFYYSVVSVTPEGDTLVSEETLEGLGTDGFRSLFITLFGSLLRVAFPFDPPRPIPDRTSTSASQPDLSNPHESPTQTENMATAAAVSYPDYDDSATEISQEVAETLTQPVDDGTHEPTTGASTTVHKKFRLTQFIPDPGYFLAGAIAGGVSRTATAPLDRLKVYLLVNTTIRAETAGAALRQGRPIAALKNATKPFGDAVRDLVRSGGVRGLFAGKARKTKHA
jgi:solute carrier family 25 phosphate transporter 23/24/25/41